MYHDILVNEILPSASPFDSSNKTKNILKFSTPFTSKKRIRESPLHGNTYNLSLSSQMALQTPKKLFRYISKTPYKVLDAPELQDDFYLNLVDWGSTNFLSVGLGTCVYLWSANTSKVMKLCDLGPYDSITSVNWIQRGTHIGFLVSLT
jgi:cell division cycle 20-like protein 1 (cofactor of APC complex)